MSDPTPAEIDAARVTAEVERRLAVLESDWERAKAHGLGDLLAVPGSMRLGGNIMRFDPTGMQLKSPTSVVYGFWILPDFSTTPSSVLPRVFWGGRAGDTPQRFEAAAMNTAGDYSQLVLVANERTGYMSTLLEAASVESGLTAQLGCFSSTDGTDTYYVRVDPALALKAQASDPASLLDGMEWYRSDTDKFRGRANGATDNYAMEGWVTATGAPPVTLAADADTLLGLTGQQLTLDSQNANLVLAGPASGGAADPTFRALVAADIPAGVGGMTLVIKTADETVNNSTVLQNDDVLLFAVAANEKWQFEGVLVVGATSEVPDFKLTFTGPSGAVGACGAIYSDSTGAVDAGSGALGTAVSLVGAAAGVLVRYWGAINNGANAGNLTLQWAQNTASVTDTKVLAGSYIKYQKQT